MIEGDNLLEIYFIYLFIYYGLFKDQITIYDWTKAVVSRCKDDPHQVSCCGTRPLWLCGLLYVSPPLHGDTDTHRHTNLKLSPTY